MLIFAGRAKKDVSVLEDETRILLAGITPGLER
jgi:hypothetical protein